MSHTLYRRGEGRTDGRTNRNRGAARAALARAAHSAVGAPGASPWETLENRLLMAIVQPAGSNFVAFEAEDPAAVITDGTDADGLSWERLDASDPLARGSTTLPSGGALIERDQSTGAPEGFVTYPITFSTAGDYKVYTRRLIRSTNPTGNSAYIADAIDLGDGTDPAPLEAGTYTQYDNDDASRNDYVWTSDGALPGNPAFIYTGVTAGTHTVTIGTREAGYTLDRIVLSTNHNLTAAALDITAAPAAPQATAGNNAVALRFSPPPSGSYNIKRGTSAAGPFTTVGSSAGTEFVDNTAANGTTYFYVLSLANSAGESADSAPVSATPSATATPVAPTNVQIRPLSASDFLVTFTPSPFATSFTILQGDTAAGPFTPVGTTTGNSFTVSNLGPAGEDFFFVVSGSNAAGSGPQSSPPVRAVVGQGATAQYFNTPFWGYGNTGDGTTAVNRVAPNPDVRTFVSTIDFDYGGGSPAPQIAGDNHSTVFTGRIVIPNDANANGTAGETISVQFVSNSDDDGYLWVEDVNGAQVLVSSDPGGHGQRDATNLTPIDVKEGQAYDFVIMQSEGGGGSGVHLRWDNPATNPAVREVVPASMLQTAMDTTAAGGLRAPALSAAPTVNTENNTTFDLTDNSSNETRFDLFRDGVWVGTAPINATSINDAHPTPGAHSYTVKAVNTDGASAASAAVSVTVPAVAAGTQGATGHYYNSAFWGLGRGGSYGGRGADANRLLAGPADVGAAVDAVDFDYGTGSPDPSIAGDWHSTAWTGKVTIPDDGDATAGETFTVTFISNSDDHGVIFVNGVNVSQDLAPHGQQDAVNRTPIQLKEGQSYDFVQLQAEQGGGSGVHFKWINPVTGANEVVPMSQLTPRTTAPAAPTGVSHTADFARLVLLKWNDVSVNEIRYEVRRSTNADMSGATTLAYLPINSNSYADASVNKDTTYYYQVVAINFEGESPSTPPLQVHTLLVDPAPAAPSNLVGVARSDGVHLCFTDNAQTEDNFVIQRRLATEPDTAFADVGTVASNGPGNTGTVFGVDRTAVAGQNYVYRVLASNGTGRSAPSNNLAITDTPAGGTGLRGTYYDDRFFTGPTVVVNPENAANTFGGGDLLNGGGGNGGATGVDPTTGDTVSLDAETFSGVFEGFLQPEFTDTYTFYTNSDDGVDLVIIDPDTGATLISGPPNGINFLRGMGGGFVDNDGTAALTAGKKYLFIGRFSENTGGAGFRFGWSSSCTPQEVIPNDALFPASDTAPLIKPAGVSGVALCNEKITVSFTDLNFSETSYEVQRGTSPTGPFTTVGTIDGNQAAGSRVSFVDVASATNPLAANTTYYYQVRARNASGNGPFTTPVGVTTTSPTTTDTGLTLAGTATILPGPDGDPNTAADNILRLTDNVNSQTGSGFLTQARPVNQDFATNFTFTIPQTSGNRADGFTFMIQGNTPTTLGGGGGGLGSAGVPNSLAVKFDIYNAINQTGVYVNGAMDDLGTDIGFDIANGHVFKATLTYNADASGTDDALTLKIEDLTDPSVTPFEQTFTADAAGAAFDLPTILGGNCAFVGFTGATGGENAEQQILSWNYNGQNIPLKSGVTPSVHVTQVFVNGQGLTGQTSANGVAFRTLAGVDNTYGYAVPAGANQLKSIPWSNGINQVAIRFDQDVASQLQQGDLVIRGVNTANYTITNFSYDPATHTGVWTLSAPVTLDKLRLVLGAAGVAGLDGDWVNGADAYPSGDGTAGGDFNFRINVIRGDATQDGRVNALDLSFVKARLNKSATNPGTTGATYSPFADIVSDGTINAIDLSAARARINNQLPAAEPAAATALLFSSKPISR